MKKLLAIILAVAMVLSMAVVASAADDKLHTATLTTASQQNVSIGTTISAASCSTVTVIITGTVELTDGAESGLFRVYPNKAGTTGNGASNRGDNIEVTADNLTVDYCAEFPITVDCNGVFAKNFTNLAAVDVTVSVYEGTIAEYEASLMPEGYAVGQLTKANFGTSGWDSSYADGVITFDGAWTGRGWWIGSDNPMTGYDSMIIQFPGAEINAQVVVNYTDGRDASPNFAINAGATSVTVDLEHEVGISQIYIQSKEEGTLTLGDVYMRTYVEPAPEAPEAIDVTLYEDEAGNTFTGDATTYLDPWGGFGICSEVNGQNVGNISLAELVTYAEMEGAELVITFAGGGFWGGSKPETEVQFNCWDTEEDLQVKFDIATLPSGVNKGTVKFADLLAKLEALGLTSADIRNLGVQVWASEFKLHTVAIHVPAPEVEEETYRGSGYFMTGDETHAMIIGKAIITTPHEFNENGDCKYCRYHTEVVVEDIIVEQPTESTEEESEDITVEEPKEDTNPGTGLTLAVIPAIIALAAVALSKKR